ncbi:exodeoxyribonuclease VII large subunit [Nocardioidaceae bacterium]|nr:exodeoxyribonuclease VII large subunit [Nocardioidaceae bacterium]
MPNQTSADAPMPVRSVALAVQGWIDRLGVVWVEGQVAQISRRAAAQTVFLTLRDSVADVSVQVTASRGVVDSLATPLVEGASVVVQAKPSYYAPRGSFSLQAREIRMVGVGELLARLERRRQLLAAEGLFDLARKRRLPFLPRRVGLVTASGSAAEKDVVEVARRRWPGVSIQAAYAPMQGPGCAPGVIASIERLDADATVDVIVVARGGGSMEDLLAFSDEAVVRAAAACRTPLVSAIGHESDNPLLDLVADLRAATPTDAAKRVVPDVAEQLDLVAGLRDRARRSVLAHVDAERRRLVDIRSRPVLADPRDGLTERLEGVHGLRDRARRVLRHGLDRAESDLAHGLARVRALSPLATLERGYAVVQRPGGEVVLDAADVPVDAPLDIRLARGRLDATTTRVRPDETSPSAADERPADD